MSVFRIEKDKNYTVMSNYHLRDLNLSYKAKGLLSFMLSLPEDWDYSLQGLVQVSKENETAIRSALKELENYHYLERKKVRNEKGLFIYDYYIYEKPINPYIYFPYMDNPHTENHTQINTKITNTNKEDKLDICPLTKQLIEKEFISKDDLEFYRYDSILQDLKQTYDYKNIVIVMGYVISKMKNKTIQNKYSYFKTSMINNLKELQNKGLPTWLNEDIKKEALSPIEQEELEMILSKYQNLEEERGLSL